MIGRKMVVGLSLLCALLFSAMAVQSAVAAPTKSVRTTAFTCVKEVKPLGPFDDEHCTKPNAGGTGNFTHLVLPLNTTTKIEASKKAGSANPKLIGEAFGVKAEVECEKGETSAETSNIHNVESGGAEKKHTVTGEATTSFSGKCTVTNQKNCTVKEPITAVTTYEGVEGEVAKGGKKEMGVEFKPKTGTTFTTLEFSGAFCLLPAKAEVTGTAVATGVNNSEAGSFSGAINVFTKAMTEETLKFAGNPSSFTLESTVKMTEKGNAIALTTVT